MSTSREATMIASSPRRWVVALAAGALALTGCSAPGSVSTGAPASTSASSQAVSTELTSEDVVLDLYLESGFTAAFEALTAEFSKQYPNVTFEVRADNFQNLAQNATKIISSPDAPDLFRYPTVAAAAKAGILTSLEPYAEAYGWNEWPQGTLDQVRVDAEGTRGQGPLYALGVGYNVTGVFYNKTLAEQVGMSEPPQTLEEFEEVLADAEAAGVLPVMLGNKGWTANFPLQAIQNQLGEVDAMKDFIYQAPDATYELDSSLQAAQTLVEWSDAGYFPEDVNAIDYPTMVANFAAGEGLFMFNGDWEAAGLQTNSNGNTGFFLMPGAEADSPHVAMSAPATYVVPANAKHKDEIAFFLNWIHTDEAARQLVLDVTGATPGGPADLPAPTAPADSVVSETVAAAQLLSEEDGAIDFIANATPGILSDALGPATQELLAGRITAEELVSNVQKKYETELGR